MRDAIEDIVTRGQGYRHSPGFKNSIKISPTHQPAKRHLEPPKIEEAVE